MFPGEPRLLLVSPILVTENLASYPESCKFAYYTEKVAEELGVPWLNAAEYAKPSLLDGCHMDAENHQKLGKALAEKIKTII